MKKVILNIFFGAVCVLALIIVATISFTAYVAYRFAKPVEYLKVDQKEWTVIRDIESDGKETTKFDLYLPASAIEGDYSLIFYIHGGGFTGGDKAEGDSWCPYYAAKGMIAVSANYTLPPQDPSANINTMFRELVNTISAVKLYCEERGYHITEMAPCGISAGGCLAMLCAYRAPEELAIPVRFVFQQTGPATFDPDGWGCADDQAKAAFVSMMTGRPFTADDVGTEEYQKALDEISPSANVTGSTVPTLIAYGPKDKIVPPELKFSLIEQLDQSYVSYDYIEFPNSGHGMLNDPDKSKAFFELVDEYIEKYFGE